MSSQIIIRVVAGVLFLLVLAFLVMRRKKAM
ncbi:MAG TPA: LPXTG cell wall anchor domain-containing protein [Acidobacteriaceae bacterium]|nr:LPXTG cell wall anchor domain-containing protein [Acidobacteriaceae bacterium]